MDSGIDQEGSVPPQPNSAPGIVNEQHAKPNSKRDGDSQRPETKRGKPTHTTPKPKKTNPISAAISSWLRESRPDLLSSPSPNSSDLNPSGDSDPTTNNNDTTSETPNIEAILLEKAPKRWVVYEPMVLLPSGSFTSAPWPSILSSSTTEQKTALWTKILREISPSSGALTHLAINEGIPLNIQEKEEEEENTLRSPSGLRLLHGDFGPALPATRLPTRDDFENAFWVSTKQNGITQIWAPRYTMFSRGNIKEKARLLTDFPAAFPNNSKSSKGGKSKKIAVGTKLESGSEETRKDLAVGEKTTDGRKEKGGDKWAIDLYAGIGYFVFSYAKLGFRLLCWEINPWSVEGLRRGAIANGWDVVVLSPPPPPPPPPPSPEPSHSSYAERDAYDEKLSDLVIGTSIDTNALDPMKQPGGKKRNPTSTTTKTKPQIIVLLESNEFAERRIRRLRESIRDADDDDETSGSGTSALLDVVHVNCGFLPSSSRIWEDAWRMMVPEPTNTSPSQQEQQSSSTNHQVEDMMVEKNDYPIEKKEGWLHLHENVGVRDVETRKAEIQRLFDGWALFGTAAAAAVAASSSSPSAHTVQGDINSGSGSGSGTGPGDSTIRGKHEVDKLRSANELGSILSIPAVNAVKATVQHVEMVKTFAPDVWHVVFDVHVTQMR